MDELGLIKNMRSARVDWLTNTLIDSGRDGSERSAASPIAACAIPSDTDGRARRTG